jgi:glycosyltransferase involved in cell wall biosynthesis
MVAPHIQQDALALWESGQLHHFRTAFHYDSNRNWQKLLKGLGRMVGTDFDRELRKRSLESALLPFTSNDATGELLRLFADKIDRSHRLGDLVWEKTELSFDRSVARHCLAPDVEAVFGYEHACLETFRQAKRSGRKTAYVLPAPEAGSVNRMMEDEAAKFPVLRTPLLEHTIPRESRRAVRRENEWKLADTIMVASAFTRDTYSAAGRDISRVKVIPLGAPPPENEQVCLAGGSSLTAKPIFLWAGTFGVRKGAHYLIQAWRDGNLGRYATLKVFGSIGLPDELMFPLPAGVELGGAIPRSELMQEYLKADALVFPTLCDGFGMVATEAWSRGLPVITTPSAGVAQSLSDGVNGLLIPAGNAEALRHALEWCIKHRDELRAMRKAARESAAAWQWSDYRQEVAQVVAALAPCSA